MKIERINKTVEIMKDRGLEAVVYGVGANFQYLLEANDYYWQRSCMNNIDGRLTSYLQPEVLLYLNTSKEIKIIVNRNNRDYFIKNYKEYVVESYMDQFEDALAPFIKEKNIAVGISANKYICDTLKAIRPNVNIVDGEDLLKDIRCFKDKDEIEALRKIAKFTDDANMYVLHKLRPGMSQREAENLLVQYGYQNNIDDLSFPPTVGFKTRNTISSSDVEYYDREWKLTKQTGIAFDVGFMNDGYCSDWGRTLYYGKAPNKIKDAYHALQAGQQYMLANIVPHKTNVNELYKLVQKKVAELGFKDDLRFPDSQMLGHQIGIDCHEFPMVNKDFDFIIKPGMVFASEPKMWFKDEMYMRAEDMILVTEAGAEFLTNFPRDLFEIDL